MAESAGRHARISSQWLNIDEVERNGLAGTTTRPEDPPEAPTSSMTLSDRKKEFRIIAFILSPAILTTFVFLGLYWNEEAGCGAPLRLWCLVEAFRLMMSISLSWFLQRDVERTIATMNSLDRLGRGVSMFSFLWFVLGHIWLWQGAGECNETAPHLFHLTLALVVLQYTLMLLPLIVLLILTPFLCLCLPCLLQGYLFFQKSQVKGASKREINRLPTLKYERGNFADKGYDEQCSICIADFEEDEIVRVLRCSHVFHKDCVDSWLTLNGTCPICRNEISRNPSTQGRAASPSQAGLVASAETVSLSSPPTSFLVEEGVEVELTSARNGSSSREPSAAPAQGSGDGDSGPNSGLNEGESGPAGDGVMDLASSSEPTTGERLSASGMLWRRMFSFRTLFSRRRARSVRRQSSGTPLRSAPTATASTAAAALSLV